MFDLSGRVAVVTGASSGLGVTFAEALASAGASVAVAARRRERIEEVAARINDDGGRAIAVECDVTDPESTERLMATTVEELGGVDVVVANAGVVAEGAAVTEKVPPALFDQTMAVNVAGTFNTCQAASKRMLAGGGGVMITLASVAGLGAHFEIPIAYGAAKAAIINMTQHMALRWGSRGVRVNCLAPGWFPSEMTDFVLEMPVFKQRLVDQTSLGRIGEPEELVGPLLLLASDAGSYMTGTTLVVDGGTSASLGEAPPSPELVEMFAGALPDGLGVPIMPGSAG
jgi:NAD(P)-dependent dehydrogenase (short-subunit alcohol dehydrogenase family)